MLLCLWSSWSLAAEQRAATFTLDNGMEVVVVPDHRAPVAVHMIWYRVGSADDPRGESGIAHFLEHLMFKGTDTLANGEFSNIVSRNGGQLNAFTSWDYTAYYEKVAIDRLELVMGLEADRMVNLAINEETVLPERDVVLEERNIRVENEPSALFREQMMAAQYLAHTYGIPIIGWKHELAALGLENALTFYDRNYGPNNAILVIAGDVTLESVKPLAEKYYGGIGARETVPRFRPAEPPQLAARRLVMSDVRVRQPIWRRSYLAPGYLAGDTKHVYALEVLADVLGGGSTSRLYRGLIVERKVAAAAGAWYSPDAIDLPRFNFYGSPNAGGEVADVEAALDEVVAQFLAEGATEKEVERSKRSLVAAAVYARDSLIGSANQYGAALAMGMTVEHVEEWPDRIAEVTVEQVNAAARAVLRPKNSVTGALLPELTEPSEGEGQ